MTKLVLCALVVLAVVAMSDAAIKRRPGFKRGGGGHGEVSASERSFNGERAGLKKGSRGALGLQQGSGLKKGNRAKARRGRGDKLRAGNKFAGERFNNHKEYNEFGAVDDLRKSNNFALQMQKSDDLAKHQAVNKNNGLYHSSGEKMLHENMIDTEFYSEEEASAQNLHDEHDDLAIDAANEDRLEALEERKEEYESSFESFNDGGFGIGGFGFNKW